MSGSKRNQKTVITKVARRYLSRKDLARELEVSVRTIERNEVRLGLHKARCDLSPRLIRYDASVVAVELRAHRALIGELSC